MDFDFDDMVLWTIEKLEELEDFQQMVSEGIKYLFVDEFQGQRHPGSSRA